MLSLLGINGGDRFLMMLANVCMKLILYLIIRKVCNDRVSSGACNNHGNDMVLIDLSRCLIISLKNL